MANELDSKKTDHLILLVGTNPLPNYVAAKLLLNEGGQLYLLHSAGTRDIADHIGKILNVKTNYDTVDESDAADIERKITNWIENIPSGETIGLNYTGGTKMMAVHAHRAFLSAMEKRSSNQTPVCSYLDARHYEMKFDPVSGCGGYGVPILKSVNVSLEKLLKLHNIELTQKSATTDIILPASVQLLAQLHTNDDTAKAWRHWCKTELRQKAARNSSGRDWQKNDTKLSAITLKLPQDHVFTAFNHTLCEELGLPQTGKIVLGELQENRPFAKKYYLLQWLDGTWLEYYVLNAIKAISKTSGIHDVAMSLETIQSPGKPHFEFDVGAMKGYQLFGISCSTTQNKGLAKGKLFEAYIRAKQLGGDEARIGLVCPQPGLRQKLEKELPESIQGKVRVFDAAHILNLGTELQNWFENA